MIIQLQNVRSSMLDLFQPYQGDEGEGKYGGHFLFDPKHPAYKAVNDGIQAVAKEKWGAKAEATLKALTASGKICLRDGATKSDKDGYEGNFFVSARNANRPTAINRDRSPVTEADGIIYSGCFVNVSIELWAQDNKFGKRVNATLRGVQFFKDGPRFGGGSGPAQADEFADLGMGEEASGLAD